MPDWPQITRSSSSLLVAYQLENASVLLVGGGHVAADRLRSILHTGCKVTLVCPQSGLNAEVSHRIHAEDWNIHWRDRQFQDSDITDEKWDMVLTAIDSPDVSRHIYDLAHSRNTPTNVADVPPLCNFYFGSIIRRGALQVLVSTSGKGPRLANRIRRILEASLPEDIGDAVENVGRLREKLREIEHGQEKKVIKKRMDYMIRVSDAWTYQELAQMDERMMDDVLKGWFQDKPVARSYATVSKSLLPTLKRLFCPYWLSRPFSIYWWFSRCTVSDAQKEEQRKKCPGWQLKLDPARLGTPSLLIASGSGFLAGVAVASTVILGLQRYRLK